jgi:5'(3')-deoxyribonucleotidase
MKVNLFLDMDGTLAKFYANPNYMEKMFEPNYFATLKPYAIVDTIKEIIKEMPIVKVMVLSACVDTEYCEEEKQIWLDHYLPEIPQENRAFCKVGEDKTDLARLLVGKDDINILLDDYSVNLEQWQAQGWVAIKYVNGINDKQGKDYKLKVKSGKQLKELLTKIILKGGVI